MASELVGERRSSGLGGCGSAGDSQDARWSAEPVDAGRGWSALGGEVQKQSAASSRAGERVDRDAQQEGLELGMPERVNDFDTSGIGI